MRTRSRSTLIPSGCTLGPYIETFEDSSERGRVWKPCSHSSVKVTKFVPPSVAWSQEIPDYGIRDSGVGLVSFPGYTWANSVHSGFVGESFTSEHDATLPRIDLDAVNADLSRSSTNLAEGMATFRDTLELFSRPGAFFRHLKRSGSIPVSDRPLKELKNALNRAGETWLEGTYGYLPLLSDLVELSRIATNPRSALSRLSKPITKDIRSHASSTRETSGIDYEFKFKQRIKESLVLKRLVRIQGQPNPEFQSMCLANQMATFLGLNDFGRLLWELTPYSFVADWFTDLGKSVSSYSAFNGVYAYTDFIVSTALSSVLTQDYSVVYPTKPVYEFLWGGYMRTIYSASVTGGTCSVETKSFTRSGLGSGSTDGSLFSNGLTSYKTATGFALLHSFGRRALPSW